MTATRRLARVKKKPQSFPSRFSVVFRAVWTARAARRSRPTRPKRVRPRVKDNDARRSANVGQLVSLRPAGRDSALAEICPLYQQLCTCFGRAGARRRPRREVSVVSGRRDDAGRAGGRTHGRTCDAGSHVLTLCTLKTRHC